MKRRAELGARRAALVALAGSQRRELADAGSSIEQRLAGAGKGLIWLRRLMKKPAMKAGLGALLLAAPRSWGWRLLKGAVLARLLSRRRRR